MITPVQRHLLSDAVFEQLRSQIVTGKIEAGATLPAERVLCDMLQVNRGALREALKRLEQARLVSIQHGGPTRVLNYRETAGMDLLASLLVTSDGRIDTEVVRSLMEMRSALAPDIARLAAERGGTGLAQVLDGTVERMRASRRDVASLQALSLEFWDTLVEGSRNVAYRLAFNTLKETYSKFQHLLTQVLAVEMTDLDSYAAIARAVASADPVEAESRSRALVRRGADSLGTVLAALEGIAGGGIVR